MKALTLILIAVFMFSASAHADDWYCEADCGSVVLRDLGGSFSYYLAPFYQGETVAGEGSSITSAFQNMKSQCSLVLHSGFIDNRPGVHIKLNTRVSPSQVCRRM